MFYNNSSQVTIPLNPLLSFSINIRDCNYNHQPTWLLNIANLARAAWCWAREVPRTNRACVNAFGNPPKKWRVTHPKIFINVTSFPWFWPNIDASQSSVSILVNPWSTSLGPALSMNKLSGSSPRSARHQLGPAAEGILRQHIHRKSCGKNHDKTMDPMGYLYSQTNFTSGNWGTWSI